jgi:hypothetical protein
VLSVRDRGETDGAEPGPRELEGDDLGEADVDPVHQLVPAGGPLQLSFA